MFAKISPALSAYGIEPSTITIPSSYDAAHVLQPYRSLSIATAPFSSGAPVPALDFNLQGQYGWIRRAPHNLLVAACSRTPPHRMRHDAIRRSSICSHGDLSALFVT